MEHEHSPANGLGIKYCQTCNLILGPAEKKEGCKCSESEVCKVFGCFCNCHTRQMKMITLSGDPISTNHLYKRHGHITYMTTVGKKLKESYQLETKTQWQGNKCLTDPLQIIITLYFKDKRRRDWDNWHKLSMDALTGIVYKDDSQIKKAIVEMKIDKENPRIEIAIDQFT